MAEFAVKVHTDLPLPEPQRGDIVHAQDDGRPWSRQISLATWLAEGRHRVQWPARFYLVRVTDFDWGGVLDAAGGTTLLANSLNPDAPPMALCRFWLALDEMTVAEWASLRRAWALNLSGTRFKQLAGDRANPGLRLIHLIPD